MTKSRFLPWLVLAAILLVGAAPVVDIEECLRRGNEAFGKQQYKEALDWYEKAGDRSTDPGQVAFNQAAAHYHLGQFREAELYFHRCLEDANGPRAAQALFGLGNSLLMQAGSADVDLLKDAIKCYQLCRQRQDLPTDLKGSVLHNLELARLLLAQAIIESAKQPPPENGGQEKPKSQKNGATSPKDPSGAGQNDPSMDPSKGPTQMTDNLDPKTLGQATLPQRGNPPVIPDEGKLVPISAADSAMYLQQIAERLAQESQKAHAGKSNPVQGLKDW